MFPMGDFDGAEILASLFVSSVGFVFFSYGRKMTRPPQILAGITLMAFPYFVSGTWVVFAVAALVLGLLWAALRLGW